MKKLIKEGWITFLAWGSTFGLFYGTFGRSILSAFHVDTLPVDTSSMMTLVATLLTALIGHTINKGDDHS